MDNDSARHLILGHEMRGGHGVLTPFSDSGAGLQADNKGGYGPVGTLSPLGGQMRISEPYLWKGMGHCPRAFYGPEDDLPMASQVARPSKSAKSMPLTAEPSSPTALAGIESFTHWPVAGRGPA